MVSIRTMVNIPCNEFVEIVTEYLEGALAPDAVADIDTHLAECSGCASVLAQFHETIRQSGRLGEIDLATIDPDVRMTLLSAFSQRRGSEV